MKHIILDFEATCWKYVKAPEGAVNEIIEFGAVMVNDDKEVIDEFCEFVKPITSITLSKFCLELTTITQEEVDEALDFPMVSIRFRNWIGEHLEEDEDYCIYAWGKYDKDQFEKDCVLHDMETNWFDNYVSLKHKYSEILGISKRFGMKKALSREDIPLDGTHHRGIDDAKNIAKLFIKRFDELKYDRGETSEDR